MNGTIDEVFRRFQHQPVRLFQFQRDGPVVSGLYAGGEVHERLAHGLVLLQRF